MKSPTAAVVKPSVCPLDCPDTCSLSVTVEGGRITQVRGSTANPFTRGVICNKVTRYPELVHGPDRLLYPLRRTGPKGSTRFERISWDAALDIVHERFSAIVRRHGPQAIAPLNYAGPHGQLAYASMDLRFFHKLGASRLNRVPMCGGIRTEAYVGTFGAAAALRPELVEQAQLIVVWGFNVSVSGLHLMPVINKAKANGARVIVVDPRRTKVAEQADLHVPLRPGTDVLLGWAVAAELERTGGVDAKFCAESVLGAGEYLAKARALPLAEAAERCGIPEAAIRQMAEWYRLASPAAILCGNGLERNRNGGSGMRAAFALPALAGKFGVAGGGVMNGAGFAFPKTSAKLHGEALLPPGTRTLNILDIGRHLVRRDLAPPLEGLFVYNHNPLIVHPDQNTLRKGLAREDVFTVVSELSFTDTCAYADVILPAASDFEHGDVFTAYGTHHLQRSAAVIPPVGESLPNTEIFRRLAKRFGFTEPAFQATDAELMDDALDGADPRMKGLRPSQLPLGQSLAMDFDGEPAVLFKTTRPKTPSGKVELVSEYLAKKYGQPLPTFTPLADGYPLSLISPSSDQRTSSTFGGLKASDEAWIEMHPADAHTRGLREGELVRMWNDLGEVRLPLRVTDTIRPGVVCSFKGAWLRTSDNGQTVSALAPATKADLCEGACYNDARVEVQRMEMTA
jgi:anaerobic selenocysteine-containing dehydrogenase